MLLMRLRTCREGASDRARGRERRPLRGEQGQILPLMMFLMLLILAAGVAVYWLGFATSESAKAQTAADAAALAAEKNAVDQLSA